MTETRVGTMLVPPKRHPLDHVHVATHCDRKISTLRGARDQRIEPPHGRRWRRRLWSLIPYELTRLACQRLNDRKQLSDRPSREFKSRALTLSDECQAIVVKKIRKQRIVSIVTDGYSNTNSASIMNFMVVAPEMPSVFWSSIATGSAQHDSDYIATELGKVIDEVQATTGARVSGVLTDNASNMVCAVDKLEETRPVLGGGCAANVINLLLQDVFKFKPVVNIKIKALAITRFVRAHHAVLDHFRSLQDDLPRHRALVTPVQTRWYSMHACLRSVLTNKPVLKGLFGGTDAISKELMGRCCYKSSKKRAKVAKLLGYTKDWQFWRDLTALIELMDPIVDSLRVLESDKCYASQVYEEFRGLLANDAYRADDTPYPGTSDMSEQDDEDLDMAFVEQEYEPSLDDPVYPSQSDEENEEEEDEEDDDEGDGEEEDEEEDDEGEERLSLQARFYLAIQKRWNFVHTDAMGMAFLLDPTKDIDGFAAGDLEAAISDACKYMKRSNMLESMQVEEDDFIAAINKFVAEKTVMDPTKRHNLKKTSPRDWWFSARRRHPLLGELAELVFAIPTSSAASERAWSIFDFIHRKKRNRLSAPKVEQLAYVYINFGTIWKESLDLARIQSYPESFASEDNDGRLNNVAQSQVSL